jgi:hypothetical protein
MTPFLLLLLLAGDEPEAARLWTERCASCHVVPEPKLPADRLWIAQVAGTT